MEAFQLGQVGQLPGVLFGKAGDRDLTGVLGIILPADGHPVQHRAVGAALLKGQQLGIVPAVLRVDRGKLRKKVQDFHIGIRQRGDRQFPAVRIGEAPLEGNLPGDIALGQLLLKLLVAFNGNPGAPQIQLLRVLGVGGSFHKNMILQVQVTGDQGACQGAKQNHGKNDDQNGHAFLRHGYPSSLGSGQPVI